MIASRPGANRVGGRPVPAFGRQGTGGPLAAGFRPKSALLQIHHRSTQASAKALPIGVSPRYKD